MAAIANGGQQLTTMSVEQQIKRPGGAPLEKYPSEERENDTVPSEGTPSLKEELQRADCENQQQHQRSQDPKLTPIEEEKLKGGEDRTLDVKQNGNGEQEAISTQGQRVKETPTEKEHVRAETCESAAPPGDEQLKVTSTEDKQVVATFTEVEQLKTTHDEQLEEAFTGDKQTSTETEQLKATSTEDEQLKVTSTGDEQLTATSAEGEQLKATSTGDEQLKTTSTGDEQLKVTSTDDEQLKVTSTEDEQLKATSTDDEQLKVTSTEDEQLKATSTDDEQLKVTSTEDEQLKATFTKTEQRENDGQVNATSAGDEHVDATPTGSNSPTEMSPDAKAIEAIFASNQVPTTSEPAPADDSEPIELREFTREELKQFKGDGEDGRILLALNGKVYDVTAGKRFYAAGGPYDMFAGGDATRGLGTFNMKVKDGDDDLSDLKERHWKNVERWEKTFSEKYKVVGTLKKPPPTPKTPLPDGPSTSVSTGRASSSKKKTVTYRAPTERPTERTVLTIGRARGSISARGAASGRYRSSRLCCIL